jgi:hypothetical protein
MKAKIRGLEMVVQVFVAMRNLLGDLWLVAAASISGSNNTWEVLSHTFQGKNLRSGLCLAMDLLKAWARTFSRVKTYDLWSNSDNVYVLFSSWRRRYWSWTSSAILVVFVLLVE